MGVNQTEIVPIENQSIIIIMKKQMRIRTDREIKTKDRMNGLTMTSRNHFNSLKLQNQQRMVVPKFILSVGLEVMNIKFVMMLLLCQKTVGINKFNLYLFLKDGNSRCSIMKIAKVVNSRSIKASVVYKKWSFLF